MGPGLMTSYTYYTAKSFSFAVRLSDVIWAVTAHPECTGAGCHNNDTDDNNLKPSLQNSRFGLPQFVQSISVPAPLDAPPGAAHTLVSVPALVVLLPMLLLFIFVDGAHPARGCTFAISRETNDREAVKKTYIYI